MVNITERNWLNWIGLDFPAPLKVNGMHIKLWLSFCCILEIQCFDHVCLLHHVFSLGKMCDLKVPFLFIMVQNHLLPLLFLYPCIGRTRKTTWTRTALVQPILCYDPLQFFVLYDAHKQRNVTVLQLPEIV